MIKDSRFIPLEEHEPIELDEEFDEEITLDPKQKKSVDREKRNMLFVAS